MLAIILLFTCIPAPALVASAACYGNAFNISMKIINVDDSNKVVATKTISDKEVTASSSDNWNVTLKAGVGHKIVIDYKGPEGNSGYVASISKISSTLPLNAISGVDGDKKTSSTASARFNNSGYGKHTIDIALDAQVNVVSGGTFTGAARNIKVNIIFEGAGAKEKEVTTQLIPGKHTMTAATNESADKYTYEWKKTGSSTVLGTGNSYTAENAADGEQYVVTIKRKDTRTVDGCTGSAESWKNIFNIKATNFTPPQPVANLVYDGTAKTIFTPGQAADGYSIFYYPSGFNGLFGYDYNGYWNDNTYINAGSYVVKYYVTNGVYPWEGTWIHDGSINCVINPAPTTVGAVKYTGGDLYDDMKLSQVQLTATDASVGGTVTLTGSGKLTEGTNAYSWKFKPSSNNYREVTGSISLTASHRWQDATCTTPKTCAGCGATEGEALGHSLKYTIDKELVLESCEKNCGHNQSAKIVAENSYIYTGSALTPADIVYSEGWMGEVKTPADIAYEHNIDVGTAKAKVTINGETISKDFSIGKKTPEASEFTFTAPTNLIYDGNAKAAVIAATSSITGMGEVTAVKYYDSNGSEAEPRDAGRYIVKIVVAEGRNYTATTLLEDSNWTFEIKKADAVYVAPTPKADLVYTGFDQELISEGKTDHGVMKYYVSETAVEGEHNKDIFTETIPTAAEAGTYYVYYYVAGDSNHKDSDIHFVKAEIAKATNYIGAVTGTIADNEASAAKISLERTDTTIEGILTVDNKDVTLAWGENEIAYTFRPEDNDNYAEIKGKVNIVVTDTMAPTAKITLGTNEWNALLNKITFDKFFRETQTVTIAAEDASTGSGLADIYYYLATKEVEESDLVSLTWERYTSSFSIDPNAKYIIYVWAQDNAGNDKYISSEGLILDSIAPVINGITGGSTYYGTTGFTVDETYVEAVTDNGALVTLENGKATIAADGKQHTIVVTDKAGNDATVTVTVKSVEDIDESITVDKSNVTTDDKEDIQAIVNSIDGLLNDTGSDLSEEEKSKLEEIRSNAQELVDKITEIDKAVKNLTDGVGQYDEKTVKSTDKDVLKDFIADAKALLTTDNLTEEQKKVVTDAKKDAEALVKVIEDVVANITTEDIEEVETITYDNVKLDDKENLEKALEDLKDALKNNDGNHTGEEKEAINKEVERIEKALKSIKNVETIIGQITELPKGDDVETDDEDAVADVQQIVDAYDKLTDYEKSLIDEKIISKLEEVKVKLSDYQIIKGVDGSYTKGSKKGLEFTANGAYSKFTGIKVDGVVVIVDDYTAKAGSTLITLKTSYLEMLKTGKHELTVVYTDGKASCNFTIKEKAVSDNIESGNESITPDTGDNTNVGLWLMVMLFSGFGIVGTVFKKRKYNR